METSLILIVVAAFAALAVSAVALVVNLVRDIFRLVVAIGRLILGIIKGAAMLAKRLIVTVVQFSASVIRYVVSAVLAFFDFVRDLIVGAASGSLRFQCRCAEFKNQMVALKARAADVSQRTWTGKEVALLAVILVCAMPLLSVLLAAAIPVLAIVGTVIVLGAWLGLVKVEAKKSMTSESLVVPPTIVELSTPAPNPGTAETPTPFVHAANCPIDSPASSVRPVCEPQWSWFGGMVRAVAIALVLVLGAAVLFAARSSRSRGRPFAPDFRPALESAWSHLPTFLPQDMTLAVASDGERRAPAKPEHAMRFGRDEADLLEELVKSSSRRVGANRAFCLESQWCPTQTEAEQELWNRLETLVVQAVHEKHQVDLSNWNPPEDWVSQHFVRSSTESSTRNSDGECQLRLHVKPTSTIVADALDNYSLSQSWPRSMLLAKIYAGAVLVVGSLAMFLRLGTSRYV